jgi:hypothetical protein
LAHSFHGTLPSPAKAKSVTYVSGISCDPSLRKGKIPRIPSFFVSPERRKMGT